MEEKAHLCQNLVAILSQSELMTKERKARITIGLHMPRWLPRHLHVPVRLALGLVLGLCFAGYAAALAIVVHKLLDLTGDPVVQIINLALLIIGAVVLRGALIRWSRGVRTDP